MDGGHATAETKVQIPSVVRFRQEKIPSACEAVTSLRLEKDCVGNIPI